MEVEIHLAGCDCEYDATSYTLVLEASQIPYPYTAANAEWGRLWDGVEAFDKGAIAGIHLEKMNTWKINLTTLFRGIAVEAGN